MNITLKLFLFSILISLGNLSFAADIYDNPAYEYQKQGIAANLTTSHVGDYSETNLKGDVIVASDKGARPICDSPATDQCQRSPDRPGAVTFYHDIGSFDFIQLLEEFRGSIESGLYSFDINNKGDIVSIDYHDEFVTKIFQIDFKTGSATILDTISHPSESWNKSFGSKLDGSGKLLVTDPWGQFSLSNDGSTLFVMQDKIYEYTLTNISSNTDSLHNDYYYINSYLFNEQTKKMEQLGDGISTYGWSLTSVLPIGNAGMEVGLTIHAGPIGDRFALLSNGVSYLYSKASGSWEQTSTFDIKTLSSSYFADCESQQRQALSTDLSTVIFSASSCDRALIIKLHENSVERVQEIYGSGDDLGASAASNIDGSKIYIANKKNGAGQVPSMPYDYAGYINSYHDVCVADCSADSDSDGIIDSADVFPNNPLEWGDADHDLVGDFSDNCPFNSNSSQSDFDGDLLGDLCDFDDDGDGVFDLADDLPLNANETTDYDGDGIGDNADQDDDNDGWNDDVDDFPYDSTEYLDSDGDGVGDNTDAFPNDASETVDSDGDGVGNNNDQFPNDNFESKDSDSDGYGDNLENLANSDKDSTRSQPEHFSVVANAVWTGLHAGFVPGRFEANGYSRSWMPTKTGFITLISYSPEYNLELGAQLGFREEDVTIDSYCAGKGTYLLEYSKNFNEDTPNNLDVTKIDCSTNYNGNTVSNVKLVEIGKRWYAVLKYSAFEIKIFEIDSSTKKPTGEPFSYRIPKFGSDSGHSGSDFFDAIAHEEGIYIVSLNSTGRLLLSSVNLSTGAISVEDKFIEPIIIKKNSGGGPAEPLPEPLPESIYWTNEYPTKIGSNLGLIYAVAKASDDLEISPNLPNVYFLATYDKGLNLVSNEELIRVNEGEAIVCCDNMDGNKLSWTTGVAGYTLTEIVNGEEFENTFPSTIRQQRLSSLISFSGRFDVNGHLTSAELFAYDEPQVEVYPDRDYNGAVYTKNYEGYNELNNILAPINKHWTFDAGPAFVTMNMGITLTHLGVGTSPSNPSWGFSDRRFHQFASQAKESNEVKTQTYREFSYSTQYDAGDYWLHHSVAEKVGTNDYWFLREESPPGGLYNVPAGVSISSVSPALSVFEQTRYFKVTFPRYVNSASATISLAGDVAQYFEFDKTNMQIKVIGYPTIPTDGVGLIDKLFVTLSDDRITQQLEFVVVFEDTYRSPNVSPIYNLHDADKDGYPDNLDAFPNDVAESVDTDLDGIGNNADPDDDNDGFTDEQELIDGTDPLSKFSCREGCASLDLDGSEKYDALTDGLLLLRGMFGLDGSALVAGVIGSNAAYTSSVDITARINALGSAADIDGNGTIDALTDGLLTLRYLFGLQGDTLINGVVAGDATRKTSEEIEAHLETLMPSL